MKQKSSEQVLGLIFVFVKETLVPFAKIPKQNEN
jgi:hypothetical protein